MTRSVPEWQGRSDDSRPPDRVRLRVGKAVDWLCPCGAEIIAGGECDHIVPLADGGENRETNLRMICSRCHRMKTAREAHERAHVRAREKSHRMARKPKGRPMPGSKASGIRKRMDGTVERR